MSNLLFEKYLEAADKIVEAVFANARRARPAGRLRPGRGRRLRAPGAGGLLPTGPTAGR